MLRAATRSAQSQSQEDSMPELYYIGLDVHKKSISFCIKTGDGTIVQRGQVAATRAALTAWASALERPWVGALEATLFTGWIYDHLQPFAQELQVAHPAMLKAIGSGAPRRSTTVSTPPRSVTCCAATCCRAATWRRLPCASCGACCAIAICCWAKPSA